MPSGKTAGRGVFLARPSRPGRKGTGRHKPAVFLIAARYTRTTQLTLAAEQLRKALKIKPNTPHPALVFGPVGPHHALNGFVDLVEDERAG